VPPIEGNAGRAQAAVASHCHEAGAPEAATPPPAHDGCCDGGLCGCDCTAAAQLVASVPFLAAAQAEARAMHRLVAGHRAPARVPEFRPPIGQAA
jgi:hypothetical protein